MSRASRRRRGFTLIELVVVIAIMAGVVALAAPRLLPVLLYSTHEGAARHLANFGTAAIAEAALGREKLTFKIDFDTQEYWVEKLPEPPEDEDEENAAFGDKTKTADGFPKDDAELEEMAKAALAKQAPGLKQPEEGLKVLDEQARRMSEAATKRQRSQIGARADRVKHDEQSLPANLQKKNKQGLNADPQADAKEKLEPVEVRSALLGRTRLPEEVTLVMASVGGIEYDEGIVEADITPAGLEFEAKFWLMNQEGRSFVVTWDPALGRTGFAEDNSK